MASTSQSSRKRKAQSEGSSQEVLPASSTNWEFKWTRYSEIKDWKRIFKEARANKTFKYVGYVERTDSKTEETWLEGFVKTFSKMRKATLTKRSHLAINWKPVVGGWGSHKEFRRLVKNGELIESGKCPGTGKSAHQGKRTDLEKINEELTGGKALETVVLNNPKYAKKYKKSMKRVYSHHKAKKPRVLVLCGSQMTSQLAFAVQFCKHKDIGYLVQAEKKTEEYDKQKCVITENIHSHIPVEELIQFMNGSQPKVKMIILTSTVPLKQWFKSMTNDQYVRLRSSVDLYIWKDESGTSVVRKSDEEEQREDSTSDIEFITDLKFDTAKTTTTCTDEVD